MVTIKIIILKVMQFSLRRALRPCAQGLTTQGRMTQPSRVQRSGLKNSNPPILMGILTSPCLNRIITQGVKSCIADLDQFLEPTSLVRK